MRTWVFDLDNTLHDATPHIFPHISRSMTAYLQTHLQLDAEAASKLRVHYWHRYGATLLGLMRHHGTDPRHFLWHTHQFPELARMLVAEGALKGVLRRLPGRKILFSNSPLHYSRAVLKLLKVDGLFDDIYCIEQTGFRPKPDPAGFRQVLRRHGLRSQECIMVEDSPENLRTAKRLGMRTVWVSHAARVPAFVDVRIRCIADLPRVAGLLV